MRGVSSGKSLTAFFVGALVCLYPGASISAAPHAQSPRSLPDDSTSFPTPQFCGDGLVQFNEECDDGNLSNTDGCTSQCKNARCGDGLVWAGHEQCDDGNPINSDGCSNQCTSPRCGDGITQNGAGEECDDGNNLDTDSCTRECKRARCGDGIVQQGIGETCDTALPLPGNTHTCGTAANGKECQLIRLPDDPKKPGGNPNGGGQGGGNGGGAGGNGGSNGGGGGGGIAGILNGAEGMRNFSIGVSGDLPNIAGQLDFSNLPSLSGIRVACARGQMQDGAGTNYNVSMAIALSEEGEEGMTGTIQKEGDKRGFSYVIDGAGGSLDTLSSRRIKTSRIKEDPKRRQIRVESLKRTKKLSAKLGRRMPMLGARGRLRSAAASTARSVAAKSSKPNCGNSIEVLFGYAATLESSSSRAQIAAGIGQSICETNQIFTNSSIPYKIVPTGLARIEESIPRGGPEAVSAIADPRGPFPLNALRFRQRADAVVMVVPPIKGSCGYAIGMGSNPSVKYLQRAHAVVAVNCMPGSVFTLAHELGHVAGADHDLDHSGPDRARKDAFGYVGKKVRTVMAYPPSSGIRIAVPYFSSPKLESLEEKLGVRGEANNAAVLADTLGYVACYGENLK